VRRPPEIVVTVDTREQDPLALPLARPGTLRVGDYAPAGLEDVVAVERKSHPDLAACCGIGRERFRAQVERLADLRYGCLLIEPAINEILYGQVVSRIRPRSVLQTLASWSVELGVPVWFAGGRRNAVALVLAVCRHGVRHFGDPAGATREALVEYGRQARERAATAGGGAA